METFLSRKRRRSIEATDENAPEPRSRMANGTRSVSNTQDEESTEIKLAMLASLHPDLSPEVLLDALLSADGNIDKASSGLMQSNATGIGKAHSTVGYQSTLLFGGTSGGPIKTADKPLTQKGKTLFLYSPHDIEKHTPCSIIHNFLPADEARLLLRELLDESPTFQRETFQLFDRTVSSPHTMCFYVDSLDDINRQRTEYVYNGSTIADIRQTLPVMKRCAARVQEAVNREVARRIREYYPQGQKLPFQSRQEWVPNASFVNCYDGSQESVGYHADQLTYLGPRAVIGSLSLGVAREFRVRKIVARDEGEDGDKAAGGGGTKVARHEKSTDVADQQGQISIHLPHNSLLVMHAEMQEEWKHSIAGATAIDPHPIAGNKRINITYRCYKPDFHPKNTPRCRCKVPTVLRCVQRKKGTKGRYMWMCHTSYTPGQKGCGFFEWAVFDDDGRPPWSSEYNRS